MEKPFHSSVSTTVTGVVETPATLPLPLGASERRVNWRYVSAVGTYHLLALLAFVPWFYSTSGAVLAFIGVYVYGACGMNLCYHRLLTHRSFKCPLWLEHVCVYLGVLVGMAGPIGMTRIHDLRDWAQRQPDCHWFLRHGKPPLVDGFYYLNFRLKLRDPPGFNPGPGIADDRFYVFLQRSWMLHQLPIAAVLYLLGGWSFVVWGVFVRVAACTVMHWFISYFAHTSGPQDWVVDDAVIQAHNVPLMAIPTMGESWHSNHHAFPSSARHGLYPGQIDLGWRFVQMLEWLGLAWDVKLPANLPPRPGISPVTARALDVAAPEQALLSAADGRT